MKKQNWSWKYRKRMQQSILIFLCMLLVLSPVQMKMDVAAVEKDQDAEELIVEEISVEEQEEMEEDETNKTEKANTTATEEADAEEEPEETEQIEEVEEEQVNKGDTEKESQQKDTIEETAKDVKSSTEVEEKETYLKEDTLEEEEASKTDSDEKIDKEELETFQQSSMKTLHDNGGFTFTGDEVVDATVTGYTGSATEIVIPAEGYVEYNGLTLPVKRIGDYAFAPHRLENVDKLEKVTIPPTVTWIRNNAFEKNALTEIHIPDSVTTISTRAFHDNQLTSVRLPNAELTIAGYAFDGNQLTELEIPEKVMKVDQRAFRENQLTRVTVYNPELEFGVVVFENNVTDPADLTLVGHIGSTTEAYADRYGHSFEPLSGAVSTFEASDNDDGTVTITKYIGMAAEVEIPSQIDGKDVTEIAAEAFKNKGLTKVILPAGLKKIGLEAFRDNALTELTLPKSVEEIGAQAFLGNQLTTLMISETAEPVPLSTFSLSGSAASDNEKVIGAYAFSDNQLTEVIIPESVEQIHEGAFQNNNLTEVTVYNEAANFGDNVFADNANDLTLIGFTASTAEAYANQYGYSFASLSGAASAFEFTDNGDGTATIIDYTGSETVLEIPSVIGDEQLIVTEIGNSVFRNKGLTAVTLPENLEVIWSWAFYGNNLTEIHFPDSVTTIGSFSFGSNQLTDIDLPAGLTVIEGSTFSNNAIQSVYIPEGVQSIKNEAFRDNELVEVSLPDSLTEIATRAFYGNQLEQLEIPAQVESIDTGAFRNNQLTQVTVYNVDMVFEDTNIFASNGANAEDLTLIGYAGSTTETYAEDHGYSFEALPEFMFADNGDGTATITGYTGPETELEIPTVIGANHLAVTIIGENAFRSKGLTSVIIPDSVEKIGAHAFAYNTLTELILSENIVEIGNRAYYANNIATLTIAEGIEAIGNSVFSYNELEEIEFPESLRTIGQYAFSHNKLTTVTLPESVEHVMRAAFRGNQLTHVTVFNSETLFNDTVDDVFLENVGSADELTLIGYLGSSTELYANKYGYSFTPIPVNIKQAASFDDISVSFGTALDEIGLPEKIEVITVNDKTFHMDVIWDQGTPNYEADRAGTYLFTGMLVEQTGLENSNDLTAMIEVTVEEEIIAVPVITDIADIEDITVTYGTAFTDLELPEKVEVILSDGTLEEVAVEWDQGTPRFDGETAGTYEVTGTISEVAFGNPDQLKATIHIYVVKEDVEAFIIEIADIPAITVEFGTDISELHLPESVEFIRSDGSTGIAPVAWGPSIPDYNNELAGDYVFFGKLLTDIQNPNQLSAEVTITVESQQTETEESKTIVDIEAISDILISYGTHVTEVPFPETIAVLTDDGDTHTIPVTWDQGTPEYDGHTARVYEFSGRLQTQDNLKNPDELMAVVKIIVAEKEMDPFVTTVADLDDMMVAHGTNILDLDLPTTVEVIFSDESTLEVSVTWKLSETRPFEGQQAGEYLFIGTLSGDILNPNNLYATVQVNVAEQDGTKPEEQDTDRTEEHKEEQKQEDTNEKHIDIITKPKDTEDRLDVTVLPDKEKKRNEGVLPTTATSTYTWLLVGFLLLLVGTVVLWRNKCKKI